MNKGLKSSNLNEEYEEYKKLNYDYISAYEYHKLNPIKLQDFYNFNTVYLKKNETKNVKEYIKKTEYDNLPNKTSYSNEVYYFKKKEFNKALENRKEKRKKRIQNTKDYSIIITKKEYQNLSNKNNWREYGEYYIRKTPQYKKYINEINQISKEIQTLHEEEKDILKNIQSITSSEIKNNKLYKRKNNRYYPINNEKYEKLKLIQNTINKKINLIVRKQTFIPL